MSSLEKEVASEINLNTLAQSIYNESIELGFESPDFVKLMNELLDLTINKKKDEGNNNKSKVNSKTISSDLPLKTKNLKIRHYNSRIDREIVSKWFKDESNRLFLLSTTTKQILDIENLVNNGNNIFAVITLKNNDPIGLLGVINIDRKNNKGEMRKLIGESEQRGKGYATEASKIWLKYCTDYLNLNKIYINTIDTNIKNITLNRKLGLKIEGLLKKELIIDNIEHDILRMAYFK